MEGRFGHDFSRVRVHFGPSASESARNAHANAYTVGQDIVFGSGRFAPATQQGRHLIAHELAHVVQQDAGLGTGSVMRETDGTGPLEHWERILPPIRDFRGVNRSLYDSGPHPMPRHSVLLRSNLTIDADGAPKAYSARKDSMGLDSVENALQIHPLTSDGKKIPKALFREPKNYDGSAKAGYAFKDEKTGFLKKADGTFFLDDEGSMVRLLRHDAKGFLYDANLRHLTDAAGNKIKSLMALVDRNTLQPLRFANGKPVAAIGYPGISTEMKNGSQVAKTRTIDGQPFFVPKTAYEHPKTHDPLNADLIAYIVRTPSMVRDGIPLGALGVARNSQNLSAQTFFIVGDSKPKEVIEVSIELARKLGVTNLNAKNGGDSRAIYDFVFFPASSPGFPGSQSDIDAYGSQLLGGQTINQFFDAINSKHVPRN